MPINVISASQIIIKGFLTLALFHLVAWLLCVPIASLVAIVWGDIWGMEILYRWCRGFWYWQLIYALPLIAFVARRRRRWIAVGVAACIALSSVVNIYVYENQDSFNADGVLRFILDNIYPTFF